MQTPAEFRSTFRSGPDASDSRRVCHSVDFPVIPAIARIKPGRKDPVPERRRVSDSAAQSSDKVTDQATQLILQGEISGALCLFKSHLAEHPFDSKVLELVDSLLLQSDAGRLVDFFRDLQKAAPDDWRAALNLARAYSRTGKDSLAVVQLQKLLRSESDLPEVWMELAGCYKRLDKSELALRALNSLIDLHPDYSPAHIARLRTLLDIDDLEEATVASVFSLEQRQLPQPVRNWLDKLNLHLEQGLRPPAELIEADPLSSEPAAAETRPDPPAASPPEQPSVQEKTQQLLSFTMSMAILVKGGLSFGRIFGILAAQHRGGPISSALHHVEQAVLRDGEPLSKALARHPDVFSDHFLAMVEMGESTNLSRCLDRLCEQLKLEYLKGEPRHEAWPALVLACRNLVDALEAGGSEAQALAWASRACLDPTVRRALQDLEKQVHSGKRLAECNYPPVFTPLFPSLITAHEAVGTTSSAFKDLARLLSS